MLLAESHGVLPLVTRHIKTLDFLTVDEVILKQAETATKSWALKSFFLASELLRVQNQFKLAGIPFVAFKGPALAQQAFGDATIRTFSDLDLIVSPEQLAPAAKVLLSMGLVATPARSPAELVDLLDSGLLARLTHEHTFIKMKSPIKGLPLRVDLHWNVAPISFEKIDYTDIAADSEAVPVCGQQVNTLSAERCLVALSIHATKHQFADLKWLVDIAELAQRPNLDWQKIDSIARSWQATQMLDLAIYLASSLEYDLHLETQVEARLANNSDLEKLASVTIELWATDLELRESNLRQYYSYSCRALGNWHRASLFLLYELFSPNMVAWQTFKLPMTLFPFYYVLSPSLMCWNFLAKRRQQRLNA
ncbi:hypothetical protein BH10CYA1_BH10CYA1_58610 [soil metagenome]